MNKRDNHIFRVRAAVFGLPLAALLSACALSPSLKQPTFELQLTGRSLQIVQGSSLDFTVRLKRDRFTDPITVTASDLPAGVAAGAVTTTGSTATLRFLAAADAVQGDTRNITLFATAGGKTSEAVSTALSVRGVPGALDTTFGGGRVTIPTPLSLESAALAPNGDIVLVQSNRSDTEISLLRLTAAGQPDAAFTSRPFRLATNRTFVGGVAVQPDGKVVVAVTLESAQAAQSSLGVVRFTPQGELDTSFSKDGIATLEDIRGPSASSLALAPDGSVVVAGSLFNGQDRDFLVARLTSAGEPDLGVAGFITDSFGSSSDLANAVAVTPDGSIIVTGQTQLSGTSKFVLARYLSSGTKDPSFGQAGHVSAEFSDDISTSGGTTVTLQPDGKIVAAGFAANSPFSGIGLVRLRPDGQADASFGDDGVVILDFEPSRISSTGTELALEPGGRTVVSGTIFNFNNKDFALARLESNGKRDLGFGDEGRQTTDFGVAADRVNTLLRANDGRLVLVGSSGDDLALARYWP